MNPPGHSISTAKRRLPAREPSHLSRDLQAGMHRPTHIVLVGNRETEHGRNPSPRVEPMCPAYRFTARRTIRGAAYQERYVPAHLRR